MRRCGTTCRNVEGAAALVVNGWTILVHPLFVEQVTALAASVERARRKSPEGFRQKNEAKRLAAILRLAFEVIPQDPTSPVYRQGNTLGDAHRHWRRAKFFQQYRLFFRCDQAARMIVYAWVNDADTKRAYDSRTDAYRVFGGMLANGNPPGDWSALRQACTKEAAGVLLGATGEALR